MCHACMAHRLNFCKFGLPSLEPLWSSGTLPSRPWVNSGYAAAPLCRGARLHFRTKSSRLGFGVACVVGIFAAAQVILRLRLQRLWPRSAEGSMNAHTTTIQQPYNNHTTTIQQFHTTIRFAAGLKEKPFAEVSWINKKQFYYLLNQFPGKRFFFQTCSKTNCCMELLYNCCMVVV